LLQNFTERIYSKNNFAKFHYFLQFQKNLHEASSCLITFHNKDPLLKITLCELQQQCGVAGAASFCGNLKWLSPV
jgi:hypothetical protein